MKLHTRAVIAFLDRKERGNAILEVLDHTSGSAILIEYDYKNTRSWRGVAAEFRDAALTTLENVGFDPYYGYRLDVDVRKALSDLHRKAKVLVKPVKRTSGNYYDEMLVRARELRGVAERLGFNVNAQTLQSVIELIDTEEKRSHLPHFKSPDANAVIVRFKD